eukprot:356602-Chlamydomonas_euryale.AAC.9
MPGSGQSSYVLASVAARSQQAVADPAASQPALPQTLYCLPRTMLHRFADRFVALLVLLVLQAAVLTWVAHGSSVHGAYGRSHGRHNVVFKAAIVSLSKRVNSSVQQYGAWQFTNDNGEQAVIECVQDMKRAYAKANGYPFFDEAFMPEEHKLLPLYSHMDIKAGRFLKLRFLIYLMEKHPDIEWFMWMDGDALITNPAIKIEERVQEFKQMFIASTGNPESNLTLVISYDMEHWNT